LTLVKRSVKPAGRAAVFRGLVTLLLLSALLGSVDHERVFTGPNTPAGKTFHLSVHRCLDSVLTFPIECFDRFRRVVPAASGKMLEARTWTSR